MDGTSTKLSVTTQREMRYIVKNYLSIPVVSCRGCMLRQAYFFLLMHKCGRDPDNEFDVTVAVKAGEIDARCRLSKKATKL